MLILFRKELCILKIQLQKKLQKQQTAWATTQRKNELNLM